MAAAMSILTKAVLTVTLRLVAQLLLHRLNLHVTAVTRSKRQCNKRLSMLTVLKWGHVARK